MKRFLVTYGTVNWTVEVLVCARCASAARRDVSLSLRPYVKIFSCKLL